MPVANRRRHRPAATQRQRGSSVAQARQQIVTAKAKAVEKVAKVTQLEKASRAFKITRVRPVDKRTINALVYGPYGHGKTTFAGSAEEVPSMRDVLFINAESGDMSLTSHRTLDVISINKYDQLARIYEYLVLHCMWRDEGNVEKLLEWERELKSEIIPLDEQTEPTDPDRTWFEEQRLRAGKPMDEPFLYRTVILDSLSEMHKYLVYKFTGVDISTTPLDEEIERMEEWQSAQELFRLLIRSFRDLPMSVIFVSAEDIREPNRKKGERKATALPKLAGQMAGDVAGFIDLVGYLVREIEAGGETHRYLYLGAGYEGWISKHRFENLPDLDYVTDPNLASLIDLARKDAEAHGTSRTQVGAEAVAVSPRRSNPAAKERRRRTATTSTRSGRA